MDRTVTAEQTRQGCCWRSPVRAWFRRAPVASVVPGCQPTVQAQALARLPNQPMLMAPAKVHMDARRAQKHTSKPKGASKT